MAAEILPITEKEINSNQNEILIALLVFGERGYGSIPAEVIGSLCIMVGIGEKSYHYQAHTLLSPKFPSWVTMLYSEALHGSERHGVIYPGDLSRLKDEKLIKINREEGSISLTGKGINKALEFKSQDPQKVNHIERTLEGFLREENPFLSIFEAGYHHYLEQIGPKD